MASAPGAGVPRWGGAAAGEGAGEAAGGAAGCEAGPAPAQAAAESTTPTNTRQRVMVSRTSSSRGDAVGFGTTEDGDQFRSVARDAQQFPAPLAHVRAPAEELLPFLARGAEHAEVGHRLPLGRIGLGRHWRIQEVGGAISRVLYTRRGG